MRWVQGWLMVVVATGCVPARTGGVAVGEARNEQWTAAIDVEADVAPVSGLAGVACWTRPDGYDPFGLRVGVHSGGSGDELVELWVTSGSDPGDGGQVQLDLRIGEALTNDERNTVWSGTCDAVMDGPTRGEIISCQLDPQEKRAAGSTWLDLSWDCDGVVPLEPQVAPPPPPDDPYAGDGSVCLWALLGYWC